MGRRRGAKRTTKATNLTSNNRERKTRSQTRAKRELTTELSRHTVPETSKTISKTAERKTSHVEASGGANQKLRKAPGKYTTKNKALGSSSSLTSTPAVKDVSAATARPPAAATTVSAAAGGSCRSVGHSSNLGNQATLDTNRLLYGEQNFD